MSLMLARPTNIDPISNTFWFLFLFTIPHFGINHTQDYVVRLDLRSFLPLLSDFSTTMLLPLVSERIR